MFFWKKKTWLVFIFKDLLALFSSKQVSLFILNTLVSSGAPLFPIANFGSTISRNFQESLVPLVCRSNCTNTTCTSALLWQLFAPYHPPPTMLVFFLPHAHTDLCVFSWNAPSNNKQNSVLEKLWQSPQWIQRHIFFVVGQKRKTNKMFWGLN